MIRGTNLKVNHLVSPSSLTPGAVLFSWTPEGAMRQTAFQVVVKEEEREVFNSGKVMSEQFSIQPDIRISGGQRIRWFVTLWDENDVAGVPGSSYFETVLEKEQWQAKWIDPEFQEKETKGGEGARKPGAYLRKRFFVDEASSARLYATAHGIYDVWINGKYLQEWRLSPGTSQYDKRLMVQCYDVTTCLKSGENIIEVSLGDGWYRGCVGNSMDTHTFGSDIAFLCQLHNAGKVVVQTDESWEASTDGPLGLNDLHRGEEYDATKEMTRTWHPVRLKKYGYSNLLGSDCQQICHKERFKGRLLQTPAGETVIDFGQNFAGYVELNIVAAGGETVVLTHGETLDEYGNFTISNFQNPRKPECFQRVSYICKSGENKYHPTKSYFGFRYVKVEAEIAITGKEFTGIAIYSDMEELCQFTCGNEDVNRLFQNTLWSMKSNFVGVPTDCPTREKSGFTGDAQIFCQTALLLMDSYPVFREWLKDLSASAFADGGLRQVAPDHRKPGYFENSCGWCDAIEIIPWQLWKTCGSLETAETVYETMRNWLEFNLKRAAATRPENEERIDKELLPYFLDMGFHWGEWLEPGCDTMETTKDHMMHGEPEVATAYLAYGCNLMAELAAALDKKDDAAYFAHAAKMAKKAYKAAFVPEGRIASKRQCRYVRPMALRLLDEDEYQNAAKALALNIEQNRQHLNTGFLSTGEICRVLTDYGQKEAAFDLLLQTQCPGWLYEVRKGATTIWECWDGINEEGRVKESLNHYAYGAVVGWLIDRVCGIHVSDGKIMLQPHPDKRLGHAKAEYKSYLGNVGCGWRYQEDCLIIEVEIPCGAAAEIILPNGTCETREAGRWRFYEGLDTVLS